MEHLKQERNQLLHQIESSKRRLVKIEQELYDEGIMEDPTLIGALEKAMKLYERGKFTSIKPLLERGIDCLSSDRFYKTITIEEFAEILRKEEEDPDSVRYKFTDRFGIKNLSCPYGVPMVIGGKPKNRKTTFAMNMIFDDINRESYGVFISLEMKLSDILRKLVQMKVFQTERIAIPIEEVPRRFKQPEYRLFIERALDTWEFVEAGGFSPDRITGSIYRAINKRPKCRVAVIDYLQKIPLGKKDDARTFYMGASRHFTDRCKEYEMMFLIVSQLNNEGGYKETGALLEDAGLAMKIEAQNSEVRLEVSSARFLPSQTEMIIPIDTYSGLFL